jgi:hypothetical protein
MDEFHITEGRANKENGSMNWLLNHPDLAVDPKGCEFFLKSKFVGESIE